MSCISASFGLNGSVEGNDVAGTTGTLCRDRTDGLIANAAENKFQNLYAEKLQEPCYGI